MRLEDRVVVWLAQQEDEAYLVGGWVRDRLLRRRRPVYDLDVATAGDGLSLARRLADHFGGDYYPLDRTRSTGRAILYGKGDRRLVVDVARFHGDDLTADLADRDFTINALAADVRAPDEVIDQHGGMADLTQGVIRPVSERSIRNDPLRALRAIRQAAQLGFVLSSDTEALISRDGAALSQVSGERIREELAHLLALPRAAFYLNQLEDLGLLTTILPELEPLRGLVQPFPHCFDGLSHSLETVRALEILLEEAEGTGGPERGISSSESPDERLAGVLSPFAGRVLSHLNQVMSADRPRLVTLKLAALLHDTGKPAARTIDEGGRIRFIGHEKVGAKSAAGALRRLRFSNAEVRLGELVVRFHMRPLLLAHERSVSSRAVYRFFRDTGTSGVDVLLHALADHRATYAPGVEDDRWLRLQALTARMLADYWERQADRVDPHPLIDGHDLLRAFSLQSGPHVGELLEAVREAQVSGEVHTREEALDLVHRLLTSPDRRRAE